MASKNGRRSINAYSMAKLIFGYKFDENAHKDLIPMEKNWIVWVQEYNIANTQMTGQLKMAGSQDGVQNGRQSINAYSMAKLIFGYKFDKKCTYRDLIPSPDIAL